MAITSSKTYVIESIDRHRKEQILSIDFWSADGVVTSKKLVYGSKSGTLLIMSAHVARGVANNHVFSSASGFPFVVPFDRPITTTAFIVPTCGSRCH